MNFDPTYKLESKACPGVVVTLGRLGPRKRTATELRVADARAKHRVAAQACDQANVELQATLDAIPGYRDALAALPHDEKGVLVNEVPSEILAMIPESAWAVSDKKTAAELEANSIARAEIHPAFLISAVQSISGLTANGKPYTAEMLCDYGPDELFDEVIAAINENEYLSKVQAENLQLPTTSGAQGDGGPKSMNAPTAN